MSLGEIKSVIAKDLELSTEELVTARKELYNFLNILVDLAEHDFMVQGVKLINNHAPLVADPDVIVLKNIFQLYYLLKIPLNVLHSYGEMYQVQASYHGHTFVEMINRHMYDEIYKDISTLVSEHEVFFPGR